MTLAATALGQSTFTKQALLVLGGSLLIAIAAQISVPMWPVPMTLQVLAILVVGLSFGARLGAITLLAYLAEGAMGLPVFANGGAGLAYMAGPTAGFLVGFVLMAWVAGLAADRGMTKTLAGTVLVALVASALLYIPGLAWPLGVAKAFGIEAGWAGLSMERVLAGFMTPFLVGDAVKSVLAALIVTGGWAALKSRKG